MRCGASGGASHAGGFGGEDFPGFGEGLGEDAGLAEDGHEVVVAGPAGDDVGVEVVDAAAGGAAQVEADVEGVGAVGGAEEFFAKDNGGHEVGLFGGGEVGEVGDFAVGYDEEVAGVVGEAVEEEVAEGGAVNDEGGAVVAEGGEVGEGALGLGRARSGDVFHAPVGMKLRHWVGVVGQSGQRECEPKRRGSGMSKQGAGRPCCRSLAGAEAGGGAKLLSSRSILRGPGMAEAGNGCRKIRR